MSINELGDWHTSCIFLMQADDPLHAMSTDDNHNNAAREDGMKSLHHAFAALAISVAAPALAGPTATYSFATMASHTGATNWSTALSGYNTVNGTNYGNTATYAASTGPANAVTVSAWASTGGAGGYTGKIESAYVSHYTTGGVAELAITSQPGTGNTAELNSSKQPNTANNQHAIDNVGSYESLMFSFQSAVTLNSVSIGFPTTGSGLDSDATVLVYTGQGDPTSNLTARTYQDLLSNGWQLAGNILDMKTGQGNALSTSLSSKYWMVGAYMAIGGNSMATVTNNGGDFLKVSGLTVTSGTSTGLVIPEPGTVSLFGVASMGLVLTRRRSARRA